MAAPEAAGRQDELEAIQPYSMHVSSKYLELTNKKLQLTRLPRELDLPEEKRWDHGTPKAVLEPLLDYWLETYDWRTQETLFNNTLPQYRTTITLPSPLPPSIASAVPSPSSSSPSPSSLRIHFVHKRSKHENAVPLLFCHTWPASFIEVQKIVDALTDPQSLPGFGTGAQLAFHVIAPSIPGFGFSDASTEHDFGARRTADAFHQLMARLGYSTYVSHGTGWGFHICRALALKYPQSCKAVHTANPTFPEPTMKRSPVAWAKYRVARWTRAKVSSLNFGYVPAEVEGSTFPHGDSMQSAVLTSPSLHSQRPQTLAFSLCDSPIGLLASLLDSVHTRDSSASSTPPSSSPSSPPPRARSPFLSPSELEMQEAGHVRSHSDDDDGRSISTVRPAQATTTSPRDNTGSSSTQSYSWTPTELLNWTMLQWLPGPEASLRWLRCASLEASPTSPMSSAYCEVPLGISSFRAGRNGNGNGNGKRTSGDQGNDNQSNMASSSSSSTPVPVMWGSATWNLGWVKRHQRSASISAAWEAADLVVLDMREFFGTVLPSWSGDE